MAIADYVQEVRYADFAGALIGDVQEVRYADFAGALIGDVQEIRYAEFASLHGCNLLGHQQ